MSKLSWQCSFNLLTDITIHQVRLKHFEWAFHVRETRNM